MASNTVQRSGGASDWVPGTSGGPPIPVHTGIYQLHLTSKATLTSLGARDSVKLPVGLDRDEWIATQLIGVYEEASRLINLLMMGNVCTGDSCPRMTAGEHTLYAWSDGPGQPTRNVSAPEYMTLLAIWTEKKLGDQSIIPHDGSRFNSAVFEDAAKMICKRLFRVFAHAYLSHFQELKDQACDAQLNFVYKHFVFFVKEFDLMDPKDMQPLWQLSQRIIETGSEQHLMPQHCEQSAMERAKDTSSMFRL